MRPTIFTAKFQSPIWLVAHLLFVTNCNSNEFGAAGTDNREGSKKADSSEKGEMLGQSEGEEDGEDTPADISVEVSGAFLTCQTDNELPKANDMDIGFGCTVFEADGRRMDLSAAKFEFVMETMDGNKTSAVFDKTNQNYHGVSSVNRMAVSNHQVLFFANESDTPLLKSNIDGSSMKEEPDAVIMNQPGKNTLFGSDSNFHIGDGSFSDNSNSDCSEQLDEKDVQGKKIVLKVEVKSDIAYIAGKLSEICGVDRKDSYIILKTGDSYPQKTIPVMASTLDFGSFKVRKGTYSFEIRSGSSHGDLDDFVVGKIEFNAKGDVVFSEPSAAN